MSNTLTTKDVRQLALAKATEIYAVGLQTAYLNSGSTVDFDDDELSESDVADMLAYWTEETLKKQDLDVIDRIIAEYIEAASAELSSVIWDFFRNANAT